MERVLNVATPLTAATVSVPLRMPVLGLVPMARVTCEVLLVSTLPLASSNWTVTAGLIDAAAMVFDGWAPKARWLADAGVMLKGFVARPVRLESLAASV